eukprot:m.336504 g.336504  ORF g.336504 m.336504 type:complete len:502 (+) comp27785_c1_seq10:417-1922(+)
MFHHRMVETAAEWRGVLAPGLATWGVIVLAGLASFSICMEWSPLNRKFVDLVFFYVSPCSVLCVVLPVLWSSCLQPAAPHSNMHIPVDALAVQCAALPIGARVACAWALRVRIMIRFKRRSCGQHLSLGAVFLAVLVTPILVVFKLGRHVGWCSPLGAALAFLLWMSGTLKMLELLLGVSEPGALRYSRLVWLVYFCAPTEPIFVDGRPKMLPSRGNTQWHLGWALAKVGVSTLTLRAVVGYAVALPNQDRGGIGGTLLVGVIWCSLITHVLSISQAVVVEHGLVPCGGMRFPLEASHSPTELWGDRMDVAMNRMLKRSVYQPTRRLFGARKTEGRAAATVATFFVSGVLHEVLWLMVWLGSPNGYHSDSTPSQAGWDPGATTLYFLLQCIFCIAAAAVPLVIRSAVGRLPGPILAYTTLLGCTAVYLRWYLGPIYLDTHPDFITSIAKLYRAPTSPSDWEWLTYVIPPRFGWGFIPREFGVHSVIVCLLHASTATAWPLI